jgi:mRNA interferase RelE/StbE
MEQGEGQGPETPGVTTYRVNLHRKAEKTLYKLPKATLRQAYQLISELETNPIPWRTHDIKQLEAHEDTYRARVGKYRIIYWVNWEAREVTVLKIEGRGRAYKP